MNDNLELEDWMPMGSDKGPPLPRFLGIYWPWYKPEVPEGRVIDFAELAILGVDGKAFTSVVGTEATLAEPITMSKMKGVSIRWRNKTITPESGWGMWWYLRYEPQFAAPMPPPGFALRPGAIPSVDRKQWPIYRVAGLAAITTPGSMMGCSVSATCMVNITQPLSIVLRLRT